MLRGKTLLTIALLSLTAVQHCRAAEPAYTPDPEIERLIGQVSEADAALSQKSIERLAALGPASAKALNWHISKEKTMAGKARWAQVFSRLNQGKIGYRVVLELQPDGSGTVTLWSDRALLAECGRKYARLMGEPEPVFDDEVLRYNPYSKVELIKHMSDGMKFLEGRVESRGSSIEAIGVVSFKNIDSFIAFGQSFDAGGYNMLAGTTLTDSDGLRTFQYRTTPEEDKQQLDKNMLLFHEVTWEFVLDFKGRISRNNATKADGSKLVWQFNCYQMLTGKALVQASFDASGLASRPAPKDDKLAALPQVVQANKPVAIVASSLIKAQTYKKQPGPQPSGKELRERKQLVELDGRNSLPQGSALQYRWTQTYGSDLELSGADLAKPLVWLLIKQPGEYRFELLVSLDGVYSKPAEVKVIVEEEGGSTYVAQPSQLPPVTPPPAQATPPTATAQATPPKETAKPATPPKEEPKTAAAKPPEPAKPESDVKTVVSKPPEPVKPAPEPQTNAKPPVTADPGKAKELLAQGQALLKAFKYADAKDVLTRALELGPDDLDCKSALADALFETGNYAGALPLYQDIVIGKRSAKAYMNVGHCQVRLRQMADAARSYRAGWQLGHEQVEWESRWHMGSVDLSAKRYPEALAALKESEEMAVKANVKDYRLIRDLALAYHACNQDTASLQQLTALEKLGYTPDPALVADVKKGAGSSLVAKLDQKAPPPLKPPDAGIKTAEPSKPAPANSEPPKTTAEVKPPVETKAPATAVNEPPKVKPPEPAKPEPAKAEPPKVAVNDPPKKAEPAKPVEPPVSSKPPEVAKPEPARPAPSVAVKAPEVAVKPPQALKPPDAVKPPPEVPKPPEVTVRTAPPPVKVAEAPKPAVKKPEPRPVVPKKPLPPVPADFDQAMAAGKRAYEEGTRQLALNTEESKQNAAWSFDEAEAMYRGAWNLKPADESVISAFKELSKHVGAIALVRSTIVRAKVKGLVVLDAEPSIVAKDRQMYCVWEQVGGEDLGLRPENLAQKKIGVRITRPGTYKFDLAVSDGVRGGNPVSVTVEVAE